MAPEREEDLGQDGETCWLGKQEQWLVKRQRKMATYVRGFCPVVGLYRLMMMMTSKGVGYISVYTKMESCQTAGQSPHKNIFCDIV